MIKERQISAIMMIWDAFTGCSTQRLGKLYEIADLTVHERDFNIRQLIFLKKKHFLERNDFFERNIFGEPHHFGNEREGQIF